MLFGTGSAKFTRSGSTVLLEYSNMVPNWCNRNITSNRSIFDHYTTNIFEGDYSDFTVELNLWEYVGPSSPTIKFDEVYPYIFTYVHFWPHSSEQAITGSNGQPAIFFIDSMQHKYALENDVTKDVLSIHFKSISYTNLTGSLN